MSTPITTAHTRHTPDHYPDLADRHLAATLPAENRAEDPRLDPFERHLSDAPPPAAPVRRVAQHFVVVTGHRWCRERACAATVIVDELTGVCLRCHTTPDTRAARQPVCSCRGSLAAATEARSW
ncbi:hypothetical protein ABZ215_14455 [Amycolatopsis sp. NPDC006131]|uniref:hypothetical protein n=1 Tax=Amycolatopsis sp. NPDC006131 TaxID=3156731 RepID=UPI0033ABDDC7